MTRKLALIGAPSSAGAYAPGQEDAPAALRDAGLLDALRDAGASVTDLGDTQPWRWRPDHEHPRAMHVAEVAATAHAVAKKVGDALESGYVPVVLGGDCTVELGTVMGVRSHRPTARLLYFDAHPDLNTPQDVVDGALDWMGVAHLLGVTGAVDELVALGERSPALAPDELLLFSYSATRATAAERSAIARLEVATVSEEEVTSDPAGSASRALTVLDADHNDYLVHFDVDAIDFNSVPLAENTDRNVGLGFEAAMSALEKLLASQMLAALTITELNPHHGEADGSTVRLFVERLVTAIAQPTAAE